MLKKLFISLLALVLTVFLIPLQSSFAAGFKDVKKYPDEIYYLVEKGIIAGYPDGTFKPQENLTRLQAITMILREKGVSDYTSPNPGFIDLKPGNHGYERVAKAVELGFISGKVDKNGNKYFDASAPLTRGQMAKILSEGYSLTKKKDITFKDVASNNGFKDYISILASNNITTGYLDSTFRPNQNLSREHFAVFMARMLDDTFKPDETIKPEPQKKEMKVHFIDVGQGDSALIQTPNGNNILIDAGTKSAGQKVVDFLKKKDVGKLDLVVATHPHEDHIGGLSKVLETFPVARVLDSGVAHTTQTYLNLLTLIDNKNIPFDTPVIGKNYSFDNGFKITIINGGEGTNLNNASVSLKAEYNKVSFLLTGDAEKAAEEEMLRSRFALKSTVFKAGHHGSSTSNTANFLKAVKPEVAILSYADGNMYGHPHDEVIRNFQAIKSKIYSTAISGDITITTDGNLYNVSAKQWQPSIPSIPSEPDTKPTPKPDVKPSPQYPVNINTANHERLQDITGVGPEIAQRIIDYRRQNGLFKKKEDLKKVKGIGDVTYEKMKNQISI